MMDKWDQRFYRIAQDVAKWSKDDVGVGAAIVSPDGRHVTWGFNGPPRGVDDYEIFRMPKDIKNRYIIHAELNALLNATVDVSGWTMYCTKPPCLDCAMAIVQKGIVRLACPPLEPRSRWFADQSAAMLLLSEASVELQDSEYQHVEGL